MKKTNLIKEFFKIGFMSSGGGPLILAIVFLCLNAAGTVETVSVSELVLGILTSLLLAFIAGGISVIWRMEKLPLMWASFLHASILFADYLVIYLINGWLPFQALPILTFIGIFIAGYFLIWCCVYFGIQMSVKKMNARLNQQ